MTRGMIYKLIFILLLIAFSIVLILPTFGEKTMRVSMNADATAEQVDAVKKKFPSAVYEMTQKGQVITVTAGGRSITDAVMNDVQVASRRQGRRDPEALGGRNGHGQKDQPRP